MAMARLLLLILIMISLPLDQHYYYHQRRHCQWRVYTKTPLAVARLLHATTSSALSFINFKIYFYHFYY
jgi:hypothetical protein